MKGFFFIAEERVYKINIKKKLSERIKVYD